MTARRRNWLLIFVVLLFIVVLRATTGPEPPPTEYFDTRKPQVIAHQGGNLLRPGNTLLAFGHAMQLGVDVLEMDLHTAATGEVVVIHDTTVDRTTEGSGAVNSLSLSDLQALDAGYHWPFEGEARPYRSKGVRIPTFDAVLKRFPAMRFNVEIKQEEPDMSGAVCSVIRTHGAEHRVLVASFLRGAMLAFREVCPEVATSAFSGEVTAFLVHQKVGLASIYRPAANALQLPAERYGFDLHAPGVIGTAIDRGMHFDAWTVNEPQRMRELFARGVTGVITDRPDLALEIRAEGAGG